MSVVQCPACGHCFEPNYDPDWCKRVRERRQELRIPLRVVGEHLGISMVYVSDIERGNRRKPRPELVQRWEELLWPKA